MQRGLRGYRALSKNSPAGTIEQAQSSNVRVGAERFLEYEEVMGRAVRGG